jgi:hypothetical protein
VLFEESAMIACIIEYGVRPRMEGRPGEAFAALVSEIQAIDGFISALSGARARSTAALLESEKDQDDRYRRNHAFGPGSVLYSLLPSAARQ